MTFLSNSERLYMTKEHMCILSCSNLFRNHLHIVQSALINALSSRALNGEPRQSSQGCCAHCLALLTNTILSEWVQHLESQQLDLKSCKEKPMNATLNSVDGSADDRIPQTT